MQVTYLYMEIFSSSHAFKLTDIHRDPQLASSGNPVLNPQSASVVFFLATVVTLFLCVHKNEIKGSRKTH